MLRECTDSENRILMESKADMITPELYPYVYANKGTAFPDLSGNRFRINGGVILNYVSWDGKDAEAYVTIAEDDLKDAAGNPVCIQYPAPLHLPVTIGQRVLLVYSEDGAYVPFRLTAKTSSMIPPEPPVYFRNVDWNQATLLPHPAALNLDTRSYRMNEKEAEVFAKICSSLRSVRIRSWIGIILLSLVLLFFAGLLWVGLAAGKVLTEDSEVIVTGTVLLLVWGLLTVFMAKGVLAGATRGLKKLHYKKKVMFVSVYTDSSYQGVPTSYLKVYEYVEGRLELKDYNICNNAFLLKNIPYGRIIYKYSKEAESYENGVNYFTTYENKSGTE